MRAVRVDREDLTSAAHKQNRFATAMTDQSAAIREIGE
jgi:hypothetical protein